MTEETEMNHKMDPRVSEAREHMKAARKAMRKSFEALLPTGFVEGRKNARREVLLAMRSMVDAAIAHIEEKSSGQ